MGDDALGSARSSTLVVGLTGGIAAGKSAVSGLLSETGVPIIDADQLARDVVVPGSAGLQAVVEAFGAAYLTESGSLDRKALGRLVFADRDALRRLETILHPRIRRAARDRLADIRAAEAAVAVVDAALLLEMGMDRLCDRIAVVDVPEGVQLQRLMQRDGLSRSEAMQRVQAQMTRAERLARADDVIDNSGTPRALGARVDALLAQWRRAAADARPRPSPQERAR